MESVIPAQVEVIDTSIYRMKIYKNERNVQIVTSDYILVTQAPTIPAAYAPLSNVAFVALYYNDITGAYVCQHARLNANGTFDIFNENGQRYTSGSFMCNFSYYI